MGHHPSPAPTKFIQADATTFRELVQKLTGGTTGDFSVKPPVTPPCSRNRSTPNSPKTHVDGAGSVRHLPFKIQERRQHQHHRHAKRKLEIKLGVIGSVSLPNSPRRCQSVTSSPVQNPMTPLGCDSILSARVGTESPPSEEERAIVEKGFYLHPSPRKSEPPELLTLFPLTSPR